MSSKAELSAKYQKLTDREHVLQKPGMYIGSIETNNTDMFVVNTETNTIISKNINYNPGLYKLFDEGISNCYDHLCRMIHSTDPNKHYVTYINVDVKDNVITFENGGDGIPVERHPEHNVYIPEMIFAHLRSGTNYTEGELRRGAGTNGVGCKILFIWSTFGSIETVDSTRGLKFYQEYKNNLSEICAPVITKVSKTTKPYTRISFKPDYARFGLTELSQDMLDLFKKRTFDIAAISNSFEKKAKVSFNGELVPVKNFQQYIDCYVGSKTADDPSTMRIYESPNESWEYAVSLTKTGEFTQISFTNCINTFRGGKHVDYIMGQITRKLAALIEKKKKITVSQSTIREELMLFLRCDIISPSFDSQTKDYMNSLSSKFGSSCQVSDAFIEKISKMGIMDKLCAISEAKENRLAKKTDGAKTKTIRGIQNFIDANFAGTENSKECTLILCEGLSALSGIVSGLSSSDRNIIGVYPLKGKVLNVRGELSKKIAENKEIADLKKILGLESGKEYKTIEDAHKYLRYGRVMFLTDSDLDGHHIKGLIVNLFHSEWSSLAKINGFLCFMNTPILRAKKGQQTLLFYNNGEYETWKQSLPNQSSAGWTIKYFKGLGTSTSVEFKQYFANKKIVDFVYNQEPSDNAIDKVFNKKRTDDRKQWLEQYDKHSFLDTSHPSAKYEEFIDKELIHFSTYDCARSIPNMVDGLKTSLRKILYCAFKRKLTTEIKVAQFAGYVSEHSSYHHGEKSLTGAIINLAQNYVGSNNLNLLEPVGQFGGRLSGGDDAASERYIFTHLNTITRYIFPEADDAVLDYLNDDGTIVEPEYYIPIIPFALVNGISGIGTGFSSSIPSYSPKELIQYLCAKLRGVVYEGPQFKPYYEGFKGTIHSISETKYLIKGKYERTSDDKVRITELPVGTWTMPYNTFLESLLDGGTDKSGKKIAPTIKDFTNVSTEVTVDFTVQFPKGRIAELEANNDENGVNGLEKLLKLTTTESTTNMHMFDADCRLHKYSNIYEIIDAYCPVRLRLYQKRKDYLVAAMEAKLLKLSNRVRYIQGSLNGTIDLRKKTAQQVTDLLSTNKFDTIDGDYKYLIKMPMDSVTEENVRQLMKEHDDTKRELEVLLATTLEQMWLGELEELDRQYDIYKKKRETIQNVETVTKNAAIVKKSKVKIVRKP
jgi:DNA topoisomerase-2